MSLIYTPDGGAINTERQEIHWPIEFMRMLAIFAANCHDTHLGIRCEKCQQMLQGQNARADNFWKMECACRTYIGRNPYSTKVKEGKHLH